MLDFSISTEIAKVGYKQQSWTFSANNFMISFFYITFIILYLSILDHFLLDTNCNKIE